MLEGATTATRSRCRTSSTRKRSDRCCGVLLALALAEAPVARGPGQRVPARPVSRRIRSPPARRRCAPSQPPARASQRAPRARARAHGGGALPGGGRRLPRGGAREPDRRGGAPAPGGGPPAPRGRPAAARRTRHARRCTERPATRARTACWRRRCTRSDRTRKRRPRSRRRSGSIRRSSRTGPRRGRWTRRRSAAPPGPHPRRVSPSSAGGRVVGAPEVELLQELDADLAAAFRLAAAPHDAGLDLLLRPQVRDLHDPAGPEDHRPPSPARRAC